MITANSITGSLHAAQPLQSKLLRRAYPRSRPFKVASCRVSADDSSEEDPLDRRGLLLASSAAVAAVALPQAGLAESESAFCLSQRVALAENGTAC